MHGELYSLHVYPMYVRTSVPVHVYTYVCIPKSSISELPRFSFIFLGTSRLPPFIFYSRPPFWQCPAGCVISGGAGVVNRRCRRRPSSTAFSRCAGVGIGCDNCMGHSTLWPTFTDYGLAAIWNEPFWGRFSWENWLDRGFVEALPRYSETFYSFHRLELCNFYENTSSVDRVIPCYHLARRALEIIVFAVVTAQSSKFNR